jgi:hypothetical protein
MPKAVTRRFGYDHRGRMRSIPWKWLVIALLILIALSVFFFGSGHGDGGYQVH